MNLEQTIRQLIREEVRAAVREELQPELLTPAMAGELVQRSAKTVLGWVRAGRLKRYGEGRPLVSRKELLALLAAPKVPRGSLAERVPSAEEEMRRLQRRAG